MAFAIAALIGMYVGRRTGWALSRAMLYTSPTIVAVLACMVWGTIVALGVHALISWQHPGLLLRIIMGYALGAYVSIPNFGLLNQASTPEHGISRHRLVSQLPMVVYAGALAAISRLAR